MRTRRRSEAARVLSLLQDRRDRCPRASSIEALVSDVMNEANVWNPSFQDSSEQLELLASEVDVHGLAHITGDGINNLNIVPFGAMLNDPAGANDEVMKMRGRRGAARIFLGDGGSLITDKARPETPRPEVLLDQTERPLAV